MSRLPLCLALLAWSLAAQEPLPPDLQDEYQQGADALRQERWQEATEAFKAVLAGGGERPYVYLNLGLAHQRSARHGEALESFQAALDLDPEYDNARLAMPESLIASGRAREAVQILERSAAANPSEAAILYQLASAYEVLGDTPAVLDQFLALRDLSPADPEHHYRLGKAYGRLTAWCTQRLEATAPGSAQLLQLRGEALLMEGRLEEAEAELLSAREAGPLPGTNWALAQLYLKLEQPVKALEALERELELVPEHALALRLMQQIKGSAR